jgi:DNA replication protein DnaC
MSTESQLLKMLKELRLTGMSNSLSLRISQAKDGSMSIEELLAMLYQDEIEYRKQAQLKRQITHAKFEEVKTFDSFELDGYSLKVRHAIRDLMIGQFIKEKHHVIIMGPVGTGKTHLAQALGMIGCQKNKKVTFVRTNDLLNEFHRSRADETSDKLFKRYSKLDMLILDDFGLKSLSPEQSVDLYDLIAATHLHASIVITTNRKIENWMDVFYDPVMANAALDRIVNKSYRIILEGESYRKKFTPKFNLESDE